MEAQLKTGSSTREQINVSERNEVDYWTEKFGVTKVKLKAAINAVGAAPKDVEAWLKKK
jgi:hypothetical protein